MSIRAAANPPTDGGSARMPNEGLASILWESIAKEKTMKARHTLTILGMLAATASLTAAASAGAAPSRASAVIRHQVRGCHTWSFNGGAFKATQAIVLRREAWLTITNNDVMPHSLVRVAGPSVRLVNLQSGMASAGMGTAKAAPGAMTHVGASTKVFFDKAGVYRFVTKAGEDYPAMSNMKTVGEDNVLRLTVTVR
jgi:hypothetical protein